jgi:predicted DNA-binding transcriptional regulator
MNETKMSPLEVLVHGALCQNQDRWVSDRELARQLEGVKPRTIRARCLRLVKRGLVDQPRSFPIIVTAWQLAQMTA